MGIDISAVRGAGRLILDENQPSGVRAAKAEFQSRSVRWFSRGIVTAETLDQNRKFNAAFYQALVKAEGPEIADRAIRKAGIIHDLKTSDRALSQKTRVKILDHAKYYRKQAVKETRKNFKAFMKGKDWDSFSRVFNEMAQQHGYPAEDVKDPKLRRLVARMGGQDPRFAKKALTKSDFREIAKSAIAKHYEQKKAAFGEQHPGLAEFAASGQTDRPRQDARTFFADLKSELDPNTSTRLHLTTEPEKFRKLSSAALDEISETTPLLAEMRYDPDGWNELGARLGNRFTNLDVLRKELEALDGMDGPTSGDGRSLRSALIEEIKHQQSLVLAKLSFLDDVRQRDPLSMKSVAYSNLMWAHASHHIMEKAKNWINRHGTGDDTVTPRLELDRAAVDLVEGAQRAYDRAPANKRAVLPKDVDKSQHPVMIGQIEAKRYLRANLQHAGLPDEVIDELTSDEAMQQARRAALGSNQSWAPVQRKMVVHRGGVTRTYQSGVIPAVSINARMRRRYLSTQPLEQGGPAHQPRFGTSAASKADHYHARNLKLSTLDRVMPDGTTRRMNTVVGHGVLDQWDIADDQERKAANKRGAKEVIETAFATNKRVRDEALRRKDNNDPKPVKITHLSVNLVTPSTPRDLVIGAAKKAGSNWKQDYAEARYTDEQFEAFEANTTKGNGNQPVHLGVDDERPNGTLGQDVDVNVDVDTIAFSFPINPMATHKLSPDWVAGWGRVYEHNRQQMVRFVGDLGTGTTGSRWSKPGGFIGSVYDRLDESVPEQRALRAQIREQTDLVKQMFTSGDFKRGDGDPAKMGRHLLYLQGLAERAFDLLGDNGHGATASKGCKSDKDRGGVTDVELKHMAITEDMGGQILPNQPLSKEDQENYNIVSAASGQFENQQLNTGMPGSKEASHLEQRLPDPQVRRYLKGLGTFASA